MNKILNILFTFLIILFILSIFNYYVSSKNIDFKDFNRSNIDQILKEKISYNVHGGNFKVNMQIIIDLQDDRLQALKEMSGIRTLKEFMRNIQNCSTFF